MNIKNKTILITGGANGIGRELVKILCVNNRVLFFDKDVEHGMQVKNELLKKGNVEFYELDIGNLQNVKDVVDSIKTKKIKVDILINNAATQRIGDFVDNEFLDVVMTNLLGTMQITKEVIPMMDAGSTILNVLSVHAFITRRHKISYDVSKAGLLMFTQELALELAPKSITVNGISIGAANTSMNSDWINIPSAIESVKKKIPLGKIVEAKEVAKNIIAVIKNFSRETTGSNFIIDQGRSLRG